MGIQSLEERTMVKKGSKDFSQEKNEEEDEDDDSNLSLLLDIYINLIP